MEEYIKQLELRVTELERRFYPIEKVLYEKFESEIEEKKSYDIQRDGTNYNILAKVETDKGIKEIEFVVKAYTDKQALFVANRDFIFPNMTKLKEAGKVQWFKTIRKEIING